jgi:hypothetical protein
MLTDPAESIPTRGMRRIPNCGGSSCPTEPFQPLRVTAEHGLGDAPGTVLGILICATWWWFEKELWDYGVFTGWENPRSIPSPRGCARPHPQRACRIGPDPGREREPNPVAPPRGDSGVGRRAAHYRHHFRRRYPNHMRRSGWRREVTSSTRSTRHRGGGPSHPTLGQPTHLLQHRKQRHDLSHRRSRERRRLAAPRPGYQHRLDRR